MTTSLMCKLENLRQKLQRVFKSEHSHKDSSETWLRHLFIIMREILKFQPLWWIYVTRAAKCTSFFFLDTPLCQHSSHLFLLERVHMLSLYITYACCFISAVLLPKGTEEEKELCIDEKLLQIRDPTRCQLNLSVIPSFSIRQRLYSRRQTSATGNETKTERGWRQGEGRIKIGEQIEGGRQRRMPKEEQFHFKSEGSERI